MKRNNPLTLLSALLALLLLCSCFASCDKSEGEDESGIAFAVEWNGVTVALGAKADDLLKQLGEPDSRKEVGDCGGLGAQVRYEYASLILYVLETDEGDTVDQITVKDDFAQTAEGATIGSSAATVQELYGNPTATQGDRLMYRSGNKQLTVELTNGVVSAIDLLRATN